MKLHLGCYHKKIHGFINVDIRSEVNPDLQDDVFQLSSIKNNSVDLIYCCHVLEHAKIKEAEQALKRWNEILKPGGVLRIAVPDLEAVFKYYSTTRNLRELKSFLHGSQKHPYDIHYSGWDFKTIKEDLEASGYTNIRRYDWRDTEHFYVDDYSQSYLPNISYKSRRKEDTISGTLMSLNVEATKNENYSNNRS